MSGLVAAEDKKQGEGKVVAEEQEEESVSEAEMEEDDEDMEMYEYLYEDDAGEEMMVPPQYDMTSSIFTGLDTVKCANDMLLKKELTRIKADIEKNRGWSLHLTWEVCYASNP